MLAMQDFRRLEFAVVFLERRRYPKDATPIHPPSRAKKFRSCFGRDLVKGHKMLIPRSLVTLLLVLISLFFLSPNAMAVGDDWKPISPEELALKTPQVDKDADAEAIF